MNISDNQLIVKYYGGSYMYGLQTPESDVDIRFIYQFDNFSQFAGIDHNTNSHAQDKSDGKDIEGKELRYFLKLLKAGNTQSVEALFNTDWIYKSDIWDEIQIFKHQLVNPQALFKSLCGYLYSEFKLATGKRPGEAGSKRNENIKKYGFAPKNFVQIFRLAFCGTRYFNTGNFPVNLKEEFIHDELMDIKINPNRYSKEQLVEKFDKYIAAFHESYDSSTVKMIRSFSDKIANNIIKTVYKNL